MLRTFALALLVACGGSAGGTPDAPGGAVDAPASDGGGGDAAVPPDAPGPSNIRHVVIVAQENHTFDNYFGRWCTAAAGSSPNCTNGPACCEAAPDTDPSGATPVALDDAGNANHDPDHTHDCEASEMNGGAMDRYATGASCSNAKNVAIATDATVATYHDLATTYALADRYFQPEIGSSSANDMYFAVAKHVFVDNTYKPDSNGAGCTTPLSTRVTYTGQTTIADLLIAHNDTFAVYAQGYADMVGSLTCPLPPSDCPLHLPTTPCDYDPSDVPFEYYDQLQDKSQYMKDFDDLAKDVAAGQLPSVAFVKGLGYKNEHPGYGTTISAGESQVAGIVNMIAASSYSTDTLILITWDEGGGFWDHVTPPPAVDDQPYGTRVPMIAVGTFARRGVVSHIPMEHSSVVKFIEWNFLGATGQLGARDAVVNNLGSLLDPMKTGVPVPIH